MRTLGIGIVGFGFMGRTHAYAHRTIPFYYDPPPVRTVLKAVCTSREATARAARQTAGFERCTTDPMEVVEADDVDVVHVCTPNSEHCAVLAAAMRAGKHIYCEKPVTANLPEAEELAAMLPDYGGRAQVVLHNRFFPATTRAKQLVEEGLLGRVTQFRGAYLHSGSVDPEKPVNWKSTAAAGGGVVRDLGSHLLDLLDWLIGPFSAVHCVSRIWSPERPRPDLPGETMTVDAEEAAVMTLRCPDGAFGTAEASKIATGTEDELRFEIHGRHGALRFNLMRPGYLELFDGRQSDGEYGGRRGWQSIACAQRYGPPGGRFPSPKASIGWLRAHVHSLYCFLRAVAEDAEPCPSLADGLRLQRVLEAALASAATGGWVDLPRADESQRAQRTQKEARE
jgi:predicted dehydrogenase